MDSKSFASRVLPKNTFRHAERVANMLAPKFNDVAYLHDVIEDTEYDNSVLSNLVSKDDLIAIDILTRKANQTYFEYIDFIAKSKNQKALMVKFADITDHLEQRHTLKDSLRKRYVKALRILMTTNIEIFTNFNEHRDRDWET